MKSVNITPYLRTPGGVFHRTAYFYETCIPNRLNHNILIERRDELSSNFAVSPIRAVIRNKINEDHEDEASSD